MGRRGLKNIEEDAELPEVASENEEELLTDDEDASDYGSSDSEPEVTLNILERQPRVTAGT